ncbi:MAG: DUF21 domain-containing protein [Gammaproteobacteria bacterium]
MDTLPVTTFTWLLILFCISQSAMFSGLNLAVFSVSRLRLEVQAAGGDNSARNVLALRQNSNFILTTILWGNVAVNVLLTLLSDSVMAGVSAFLFSTVVITFIGEITPQAYCSRNAIKVASLFTPVLRFYQLLLYPVARPTARMLDWWLGKEGIHFYRERDLHELLKQHISGSETDIGRLEGLGAMNFLTMDDLSVMQVGREVHPDSIITLPVANGVPEFPGYRPDHRDPFLQDLARSGKKWLILTDDNDEPRFVLDSDAFLRAALFSEQRVEPVHFIHRPMIVRDPKTPLGRVIPQFNLGDTIIGNDKIDRDIILVWTEQHRLITGTDLLDQLLHGITGSGIKSKTD